MFNLSLWITDSHQFVLESLSSLQHISNVCRKPGSMLASGCKDAQTTGSVLTEWPVRGWCKESLLSNGSPTVRRSFFVRSGAEVSGMMSGSWWHPSCWSLRRSGQDRVNERATGSFYTVDGAVALLTFTQGWKWLRARPNTGAKDLWRSRWFQAWNRKVWAEPGVSCQREMGVFQWHSMSSQKEPNSRRKIGAKWSMF